MTPGQRRRGLANVLNATTPLGLLLPASARDARPPRTPGTADCHRVPVAAALRERLRGRQVVIFRAGPAEAWPNPVLLGHEERHCTQYAWCLGLPFLPLYFLAAGGSSGRTGNPGSRNFFERQAGLQAGGYPEPKAANRMAPAHRIHCKDPGTRQDGPAAPERNEE